MIVALLIVFLLFGGLALSVATLALGVVTELAGYALRLAWWLGRGLLRSAPRGIARRVVRGVTGRSARAGVWVSTPAQTPPMPRRPRWWDGPRARSRADVANLMRGLEAAHGRPHDPYWDRI